MNFFDFNYETNFSFQIYFKYMLVFSQQLQVYSQALDQSITGEMALNVNTLKQHVTIAVETEVCVEFYE